MYRPCPAVYHSMSCYFDRDSVSLPGFAHFFRHSSLEEREHAQARAAARQLAAPARHHPRRLPMLRLPAAVLAAAAQALPSAALQPATSQPPSQPPSPLPPSLRQKLIDLQNTRGGRVRLNAIVMPETEYDHPDKGVLCVACIARSQCSRALALLREVWRAGCYGTHQRLWRPHAESPSLGRPGLLPVSLLVARVEQRVSCREEARTVKLLRRLAAGLRGAGTRLATVSSGAGTTSAESPLARLASLFCRRRAVWHGAGPLAGEAQL